MLNSSILSSEHRIIFLTYGRVLLLLISFSVFLFSYLVKPFFIHWPMLLKTYSSFMILFGFYLYVLYFIKKHHQNKLLFWLGLCLDSLVLAAIMYFSNLPTSWFLFIYMLHILIVCIFYSHKGTLYLAALSSLFFNWIWMRQHSQEIESQWVLLPAISYHCIFFASARISLYLGNVLKQFAKSFKQTHTALTQMRGFNQWILQNIPAGLITFNSLGSIVKTNDMASKILGFSKEKFMGKAIQNFFPSLREKQKALVKEKRSIPIFEEELQLQDGKNLSLRCHLSLAIEKERRQEAFILIFEDQTSFREMEQKVRSSEKLAAVGKLAASIAHEIRNPLASISGCVQMLKEDSSDKDSKTHLMDITTREIDRLNRLLSDFLSYARPQDAFSNKKNSVKIRPLLKEALLLLPIRNHKLKVEWKDELSDQSILVHGNEDSLKQALLNIFINAYEAMSTNKSTTHPTITLSLRKKENFFYLIVKDNGPGISKEIQEKIFEPFQSTKEKGSGLGLSIAYQIALYHSGSLKLNTHTNYGAEFILKLPAKFTKTNQKNQESQKHENKNFSG